MLSHRNFIAQGLQATSWGRIGAGDSILAILPIFHGFGLGVCVNAALMAGGKSILVPQFSAEVVAKLLRTARPNLLVGVPTLYDALARDASLRSADLSSLRACFSGADTLPRPVKERFEKLVAERGGRVRLLEGYGLTEAVTAIMAMPLDEYREGSMGIPFPDMLAKVCRPDSDWITNALPAEWQKLRTERAAADSAWQIQSKMTSGEHPVCVPRAAGRRYRAACPPPFC